MADCTVEAAIKVPVFAAFPRVYLFFLTEIRPRTFRRLPYVSVRLSVSVPLSLSFSLCILSVRTTGRSGISRYQGRLQFSGVVALISGANRGHAHKLFEQQLKSIFVKRSTRNKFLLDTGINMNKCRLQGLL